MIINFFNNILFHNEFTIQLLFFHFLAPLLVGVLLSIFQLFEISVQKAYKFALISLSIIFAISI
jgi:hypothetical protein